MRLVEIGGFEYLTGETVFASSEEPYNELSLKDEVGKVWVRADMIMGWNKMDENHITVRDLCGGGYRMKGTVAQLIKALNDCKRDIGRFN